MSTENNRLDSGVALQLRPRLPRPTLWYSAANTASAAAPRPGGGPQWGVVGPGG
ncbi:MAG: hypothetical protein OXN95_02310 [bacterium]|nr:hypothetical protein [bacterium]